ncbi:MAG: glycosyltransferase family 4 protein, partial [Pseudomonadota bacterium]
MNRYHASLAEQHPLPASPAPSIVDAGTSRVMLKKTPHHLTTNSRAGSSQKPLRILFTSYRSHKFTGGQGVYLRLATSALADLGHSVSVVSGPPYPDLDSRVELIKLPSLDLYERPRTFAGMPPPPVADMTTRIDWYEYLDHISGGFPEPYTFGRRFARFIKSNPGRFDVIHDNQTLCYGLLDAAKLGIPVIGMIHHPITYDRRIALDAADSWKLRLLISRWYSFLRMQKKVARQLDPVIVVSKRTEDDVVKDFGLDRSRLKLVYHGVDHEFWSPRTTISRSKNRLVTVASADVPLKGLIYLLEALAILRPSWPKLRLTVIGKLREGPTKKRIDALQLADRVEFISGVTDEEIAQLYAKATIAVTPS